MAIRKIARMGHPILRQVAEPVPVEEITGPEIQTLIADLLETVEDANGAGLAAPQVFVSKRVVVLRIDEERAMEVWINPILKPITDELMASYEGCLSVPGLRGMVARPSRIEVLTYNAKGERLRMRLGGYPAVVAQHECDHLDGVVYVDKAEVGSLAFLDEYRKFGPPVPLPDDEDEDGEEGAEGAEGEE